mgnify:CR=1 FL=1
MSGKDVKKMITDAGLKCWQVAEAWGLCDSNFSRRLRKPFSDEEVSKLKKIIYDLSKKKESASR